MDTDRPDEQGDSPKVAKGEEGRPGVFELELIGMLGLFVIPLVVAIVAAILVPNLLSTIQRGKQKGTASEILEAAGAIATLPRAVGAVPADRPTTVRDLLATLDRRRAAERAWKDAWGHDLLVLRDGEELVILSPGRDGRIEPMPRSARVAESPDDDIVWRAGRFVQAPQELMGR